MKEDVDLLLFLTGGWVVASSLGNCSQMLELLQVLGVDTKNVDLVKKNAEVKQETSVGEGDTSSEEMEDDGS